MKRVKRLEEDAINKIAAGEVVNRPSSVLKELLENSLDAGSSRVEVRVEDAGVGLIEVADDGAGMEPEELRLAVKRHTTSKIEGPEDLSRIDTFGFRGEALASIGSVSRMEISSTPRGPGPGSSIVMEGGVIIEDRSIEGKSGTVARVRDLFFNTPARKKFLKSKRVEQSNLRSTFWDLAIPCPEISFSMFESGEELFSLLPGERLEERIFIREPAMRGEMEIFEEISPYFVIRGAVTAPSRTFATAGKINVYVNRRSVKDGIVISAVRQAMRGLIPDNRYPGAYIFIEVSPEDVDFNVHPSKREVRFRYGKELFDMLRFSTRKAFIREKGDIVDGVGRDEGSSTDWPEWKRMPENFISMAGPGREGDGLELSLNAPHAVPDSEEVDRVYGPLFSVMKVIGQFLGNYILLDGGETLYFIDIHAASERINHWKLLEGQRKWLESPERLLISVEIPSGRLEGFSKEVGNIMSEIGYEIEYPGDSIRVSAIPRYLNDIDPLMVAEDIVELFPYEPGSTKGEMEGLLESLVAKMACHDSIRGTSRLHDREVDFLLEELDRAIYSETCPHGRPVYVRITREQLHRLFGRS